MEIEILKKSVERFWQTVDFGSALPDGVRIATCVATGDGADAVLGDGELSIVEKGRAVRMMIEKGQPDGDHALTLVLTLSDGQVVAQDVVVRASDAQPAPAPAPVPVAKSPAREYAGHFAQPTNAAHQDAYAVRAYGSGPDDKRIFRAKTAGLPVATCPECDMDSDGERREVTVKELALSRNALSRGKMSRMASALRDGVREGDDFAAIKVAELHDGEGEGPRYAVLPGQGNHRVAHLMLEHKAGTVPVMVVPRKTNKAGGEVEGGTWITTENGRALFIADGETAGEALGRATGGAVGESVGPTQRAIDEGGGGGKSEHAILNNWSRIASMDDPTKFAEIKKAGVAWVKGGESEEWDSVHKQTQKRLKALGIDKRTLVRGVTLDQNHPLAKAIIGGDLSLGGEFELPDGVELNSWSSDVNVAGKFASTAKGGQIGIILESEIDASDIVASFDTQSGFLRGERESIVKRTSSRKLKLKGTLIRGEATLAKGGRTSTRTSFRLDETDDQRGISAQGKNLFVVSKQLSAQTSSKGAEFVPIDMAGRRARRRERVERKRKKTLTR